MKVVVERLAALVKKERKYKLCKTYGTLCHVMMSLASGASGTKGRWEQMNHKQMLATRSVFCDGKNEHKKINKTNNSRKLKLLFN